MYRVLFVCSGNMCRSPIAEGILRDLLDRVADSTDGKAPPPAIEVSSAGTTTSDGLPPSREAEEVAREAGIDISSHRTRILTREILAESDLILVMQPHHAEAARALLPEAADRIHLLTAYAGETGEGIDDPIGKGREVYRRTFRRLATLIERAFPRIMREALRRTSR